jgi:hypothetical protein
MLDTSEYQELGLVYKRTDGFQLKHTTDSSSMQIDVEQIIKGREEIFINNAEEAPLEKKKILIRDWIFLDGTEGGMFGDRRKVMGRETLYRSLIKNGFEVYCYNNSAFKKVDLDNIKKQDDDTQQTPELVRIYLDDKRKFNLTIKPITEREVIEAAAKSGFTLDEIYLAGPFNRAAMESCGATIQTVFLNYLPPEIVKKILQELASRDAGKVTLEITDAANYELPDDENLALVHSFTAMYIEKETNIEVLNKNSSKCSGLKVITLGNRYVVNEDFNKQQIIVPSSIEVISIFQLGWPTFSQSLSACNGLKSVT